MFQWIESFEIKLVTHTSNLDLRGHKNDLVYLKYEIKWDLIAEVSIRCYSGQTSELSFILRLDKAFQIVN
jgi:hypothetical protein